MQKDVWRKVRGGDKLVDVFGSWPSFNASEVHRMELWQGNTGARETLLIFPTLDVEMALWHLRKKDEQSDLPIGRHHTTLVKMTFHDIGNFQMSHFSDKNAILGLTLSSQESFDDQGSSLVVVFQNGTGGFQASFTCSQLEIVEVAPAYGFSRNVAME